MYKRQASLSLLEAAKQAGSSKGTIWRAIKSGRMSVTRLDDGGFAIDPAELFRAFQPVRPSKGLRDLLAEVRAKRDELRQDRDGWRGRRLLTAQRRPWWRTILG